MVRRGQVAIPRFLTTVAAATAGAVLLASCASTRPAALALADEYYNLGNGWFDLKKYDQASKAYQKALALNPDLKVAAVNLARTKAEGGDPDAALKLLEPVAASDPDNVVVAQYRAWLTAKKDGPAAAADLYQALAQRLVGDAATQYNAGLCLGAAGRYDEALAAWKAWKLVDGKGSAGLTALAQTLDALKSSDAVAAWSDVVASYPDKDPKRFAPLVARGRAQVAAEAYGDAVASWDAALTLGDAPSAATSSAATSSAATSSTPASTTPPASAAPPSTPPSPASGSAPSSARSAAPAVTPKAPAAAVTTRGEVEFLKGRILLVKIKDFGSGSEAVLQAWKDGYKDADAWKALRSDPELGFTTQLEAALSAAGVKP